MLFSAKIEQRPVVTYQYKCSCGTNVKFNTNDITQKVISFGGSKHMRNMVSCSQCGREETMSNEKLWSLEV